MQHHVVVKQHIFINNSVAYQQNQMGLTASTCFNTFHSPQITSLIHSIKNSLHLVSPLIQASEFLSCILKWIQIGIFMMVSHYHIVPARSHLVVLDSNSQ
eukprot:NODE_462_length_7167_cov_0.402518.p9 type:complete len:100 gc:universal NODE_462_length_7167_cov_0.402518:2341-2042(-)